jgi:hypothetical protein
MEILAYIVLIALTFFGVTSFPIVLFMNTFPVAHMQAMGGTGSTVIISWVVWQLIDNFIWIPLMNKPIPIVLFLLCWFAKLIDEELQGKKNPERKSTHSIQITRNMGEAWVLFAWAIIAMFGDYRTWF